jgi:D-arginine dehydrogenase
MDADVLIVGGGIAGLSLAAELAGHRRVLLVEAEDAIGYHSSGRSAAFGHFGIGNATVRALTAHSRAFFLQPPEGFSEIPLARRASALFVATSGMTAALRQLKRDMAAHAPNLRPCGPANMGALFPPLRLAGDAVVAGLLDPDGLRLDSDALLQGFARALRARGGKVIAGKRVERIERIAGGWSVATGGGASFAAPVLVNAAGAWADPLARLAQLPPLGLAPTRRTIIVVDPPPGADVGAWPFVKTVVDDFYILPEAGRLIASPVDEVACEACDAQPEDFDIALAAAKVEQYTTLTVPRVAHRWAGLRTFAPDRTPVVGFDPRAQGFFWLAGQGGFGLQTAPALAQGAASLLLDTPWPQGLAAKGIAAHELAPERLIHG